MKLISLFFFGFSLIAQASLKPELACLSDPLMRTNVQILPDLRKSKTPAEERVFLRPGAIHQSDDNGIFFITRDHVWFAPIDRTVEALRVRFLHKRILNEKDEYLLKNNLIKNEAEREATNNERKQAFHDYIEAQFWAKENYKNYSFVLPIANAQPALTALEYMFEFSPAENSAKYFIFLSDAELPKAKALVLREVDESDVTNKLRKSIGDGLVVAERRYFPANKALIKNLLVTCGKVKDPTVRESVASIRKRLQIR